MPMRTNDISLQIGLIVGALGLFVVGLLLAAFARPLLGSLIVAALLAYLLDPVVTAVEGRFRTSRPLAATVVYSLSLCLTVAAFVLIGIVLWDRLFTWRDELLAAWYELIEFTENTLAAMGIHAQSVAYVDMLQQSINNAVSTLFRGSGNMLGRIVSNMLWIVVVLVSFFYFLKDGTKIKPWILSWLPARYQREAAIVLDEINATWSIFLRVQLLITITMILLSIFSMGLILWLYRLGWLPVSQFTLVIVLAVVFLAVQQVDNIWLKPQFLGRAFKLHPGVVFVSLIAALYLSGILGAILVLPMLATSRLLIRRLMTHRGELHAPAASVQQSAEALEHFPTDENALLDLSGHTHGAG